MGDATFFRARLTGVSAEADGTTDPSSPSGERQAVVTWIREDADIATGDLSVPDTDQGEALVFLPNYVPCPLYAANIHFFQLTNGPVSLPLPRAQQPRVIVRRDAVLDDGTQSAMSIVIEPTLVAMFNNQWGDTTKKTAYGADKLSLSFFDPAGTLATGKPGNLPLVDVLQQGDVILWKGLVLATARTALNPPSSGGYTYAWQVQPLAQGNAVPCKITGGAGSVYTADLYAGDLTTVIETGITVTQLYIASDTVPVDTWTFAYRLNGEWVMQVPVWLS